MKRIDVSQALQILANVGVIAGILFLAFELRQNTMAVRSEAALGVLEQRAVINGQLMNDSMADIWLKGVAEPSTLSPQERLKFIVWWNSTFTAYENAYLQTREGAYEASSGTWQQLRNLFEMPGVKSYWENRSYAHSPGFRDFVETEVLQREPTPGFEIPVVSGTVPGTRRGK